jgi:hypothetical protein
MLMKGLRRIPPLHRDRWIWVTSRALHRPSNQALTSVIRLPGDREVQYRLSAPA